jgi:subtilisin family serine protease
MHRFSLLGVIGLLLTGSAVSAAPTPDRESLTIGQHNRLVVGQLLIKPTTKMADAGVIAADLSKALGRHLVVKRAVVLDWLLLEDRTITGEAETLDLVAAAQRHKGVAGAAAVWVWRALATPQDPLFEYMWHLDAIGSRAAWDITVGQASNLVGVVDTGTLFNHEDLLGKGAAEFDFIDDPAVGGDGNGRDADASDPGDACNGNPSSFHGTHVAGTILANSDNNVGISGINWNGRLVTGRALGRCGGTTLDIDEAVAWMAGFQVQPAPSLAAADRPRVINLSLGATGAPCDAFTNDVWSQVTARGHIIVVAAGNDGNGVPVASPANCPDSVAVAAFGPVNGTSLAPYSNFGPEIDIIAPGGDQQNNFTDGVLSAVDASVSPFQGGIPYSFYVGTSMAAPHVAGVISLMLDVNGGLTKTAVVELLKNNGGTCTTCRGKPTLRADLAVAAAAGTVLTTSPGDSCAGTGFCSGGQICVAGAAPTCQQRCTNVADCDNGQVCSGNVCVGGTAEGEGEGEVAPVGDCDVRRGNMDCPSGKGCVLDDDELGRCKTGRDGDRKNGQLCERNRDCGSGLCDRGVCTVTCDDEDCREGYTCDDRDSGVPGGLCRADSCLDDVDICGDGFDCSYSSESRYVCAVGASNYRGVCGEKPGSMWPAPLVAVLIWGNRRRRR